MFNVLNNILFTTFIRPLVAWLDNQAFAVMRNVGMLRYVICLFLSN